MNPVPYHTHTPVFGAILVDEDENVPVGCRETILNIPLPVWEGMLRIWKGMGESVMMMIVFFVRAID